MCLTSHTIHLPSVFAMKNLTSNQVFNVCSAPQSSYRASDWAQETSVIFLCPSPVRSPRAGQSPLIAPFPDPLTESEVTDISVKNLQEHLGTAGLEILVFLVKVLEMETEALSLRPILYSFATSDWEPVLASSAMLQTHFCHRLNGSYESFIWKCCFVLCWP